MQLGLDRAGEGDVVVQRLGLVDEHVGPAEANRWSPTMYSGAMPMAIVVDVRDRLVRDR